MWWNRGFKYFSLSKQINYLREHGIMLGSRALNGRKVFIYMVKTFFVEVVYQNDSIEKQVERLNVFNNLSHLNQHLEKEFKATF
ncbi:MAG: hypothetical protein JST48_05265 [Bacteroidetes bacterium]|nr:hypothetical protein [Bacteroidota bacterium]